MNREVHFACGRCGNGMTLGLDDTGGVVCARCGERALLAAPAPGPGPLQRCAACGCDALFVQRDFNRKLGVALVGVAALLALKTHGVSLVVAVLADLVLYRVLPRITVCYACDAVHRGVPPASGHAAYDHHLEDLYKEEKSKRQVAAHRWRHEHGA